LTLERPNIQQAVDFAAGEVLRANKLLPRDQQLVPASRGFVSRLIAKLPEEEVVLARYGYEHARRKYRGNTNVRVTEAPLERAEADHGRMDVFAIDASTGAPLGRPWLSVLVDGNSRAVLGLTLNFATPGSSALAHLFRHAFLPKFEKDKYPGLVHEWFAFGVPGDLSFDNGMDFHAAEVREAARELGIDLNWAARRQPWRKGKVERLIRSINRGLVALFGGKTFSNIFEKDDYDPTKHAVATLDELKAALVKWVCDVYHQRKHSALGCSPAEKWARGIKPSDIDMVPDIRRLDAVLGAREKRMLDQAGIEYAGLSYNCPELNDVRRTEGATVEVQIRINKENLGSIIVLLPRTGEPMRVPCRDGSYAEGLSLWQHELCKRYAKAHRRPGSSGDSVQDWRIAFADICRASMTMLEERGGKRKKSQGLANARWVQQLDTMLLHADAETAEAARPKFPAVNRLGDEPSPIEGSPEMSEADAATESAIFSEPTGRTPTPPRRPELKDVVAAPSSRLKASPAPETPTAEPDATFVPKFVAIIKPPVKRGA
jgi:putative transposase